jgi:membrane fusion protein, macrolide-specific efflux system
MAVGVLVGVWRKWIFPSIRLVVLVVIAAALVKLAFFPGGEGASDPDAAFASIEPPQVAVAVGTIANDLELKGTVAADEPVEVRATAAGTIHAVHKAQGAGVDADAALLVVREQVLREDGTSWLRDITVKVPISGTVSSLTLVKGQTVAVGEVVAKIAPPSFHVRAELRPEQQYRLLDKPADALVSVAGGPAAFTCTGLAIVAAPTGEQTQAGPSIRCSVPADVTVFAGLSANVTISGGAATDVLMVPTTAVEGTSATGVVHVVLPDGMTEPREVELGLTDGHMIEVRAGLTQGEFVLEFVPGADAAIPCDPFTGEVCE